MVLSLSNKSDTLPLATRFNVKCVGLSPDGRLAIIVDEGDDALSSSVWVGLRKEGWGVEAAEGEEQGLPVQHGLRWLFPIVSVSRSSGAWMGCLGGLIGPQAHMSGSQEWAWAAPFCV